MEVSGMPASVGSLPQDSQNTTFCKYTHTNIRARCGSRIQCKLKHDILSKEIPSKGQSIFACLVAFCGGECKTRDIQWNWGHTFFMSVLSSWCNGCWSFDAFLRKRIYQRITVIVLICSISKLIYPPFPAQTVPSPLSHYITCTVNRCG